MIRSSQHILKYQNKNKNVLLNKIFFDFQELVKFYIKLICTQNLPLKTNLSSKILPNCNDIIHSQWKQIAYKTASEIIRSNLKFIKNKVYKRYKKIYAKCKKENRRIKFLNKRFKELNINYLKRIKINVKNVNINLDYRLINIQKGNFFNEFILIRTPYFQEGKKRAIVLKFPIKYHKHSLKFKEWKRKNYIRLRKNKLGQKFVDFVYEKEIKNKEKGKILSFGIGYKKLLVDNYGNKYGKELLQIYEKLSKKQRESKKYKKLLIHKKNKINEIINKIDFSNVNIVFLENLKNIKKNSKGKIYKKFINKLQYWSYKQVIEKFRQISEIEGFYLKFVNPAYTSQTCSKCGNIDKSSRKREIYQCSSCGLEIDADLNATINIHSRGVYSLSGT